MPFPNTKRLTFRQFSKDDLNLLLQLDTDPNITKYITLGKHRAEIEIAWRKEVFRGNGYTTEGAKILVTIGEI